MNPFDRHAHFLREVLLGCAFVRQELMQGWVEEANCRWTAGELLEHADEVLALIRKDLREGLLAMLLRVGKNHFAHRVDAVALEEHVLRSAKTDSVRPKCDGVRRLLGSVRV